MDLKSLTNSLKATIATTSSKATTSKTTTSSPSIHQTSPPTPQSTSSLLNINDSRQELMSIKNKSSVGGKFASSLLVKLSDDSDDYKNDDEHKQNINSFVGYPHGVIKATGSVENSSTRNNVYDGSKSFTSDQTLKVVLLSPESSSSSSDEDNTKSSNSHKQNRTRHRNLNAHVNSEASLTISIRMLVNLFASNLESFHDDECKEDDEAKAKDARDVVDYRSGDNMISAISIKESNNMPLLLKLFYILLEETKNIAPPQSEWIVHFNAKAETLYEWLREVCAKKTIDLEYIENYITSISSTKSDMMPTKKKFKSAKERKYEIKESADRKLKSKIINEKPKIPTTKSKSMQQIQAEKESVAPNDRGKSDSDMRDELDECDYIRVKKDGDTNTYSLLTSKDIQIEKLQRALQENLVQNSILKKRLEFQNDDKHKEKIKISREKYTLLLKKIQTLESEKNNLERQYKRQEEFYEKKIIDLELLLRNTVIELSYYKGELQLDT